MLVEGIRSLAVAPNMGRTRPLGILRVYPDQPRRFGTSDAQCVMAIARQGAVANENAMAHEALQQADNGGTTSPVTLPSVPAPSA